jgi:hypothetical protein
MGWSRPVAAALSVVTALAAADGAEAAVTAGNRAAQLFPDLLVAALLALAAAALLVLGRLWPGLGAAAFALLLLAWLPASAHWTETAIKEAAGPCPPFTICKLQAPLSIQESALLGWLTTLSLAALVPALLAVAAGIAALPETSCRPRLAAVTAFLLAAPLAGAAAAAPWLAGGPPYGFDDRAAFFTVFAEMAALGALLAALASARGRPLLSALLGAGALGLLLFTVAGLPFTDWVIAQLGQSQPCQGFYCPPAFDAVESRARLLMLLLAAPAALLAAAGVAVDGRYRLVLEGRRQGVQQPV